MRLLITKKAEKSLNKIPDSVARNISKNILNLSKDPFPPNSKKLQGENNHRLRIGVFRVVYTVDKKKKEITVLRIAHRREVYR